MADEYIEYDFDPHNLPQALLTAIGFVATCAAQTEQVVEAAIGGCLGLDSEYGASVTTHMAMPLRFSVLRSVAEIKINNLDDLDELDRLLDEIDAAFVARNEILHHLWARNPTNNDLVLTKETARSRYEIESVPMTVDQVKITGERIYKAGIDLMAFLIRISLVPSPPPIRPRHHKSKAARKKRREAMLKRGGA
jgi:hypothetical protein